ncbi:MAG: hypothetical protein AAF191_10815 [Verrucomicrobiota bacterium]
MYLHGIASTFPTYEYSQQECWEHLRDSPVAGALRSRSMTLLEKVLLGNSGIEKRHFCIAEPMEIFKKSASELNQDFEEDAAMLGGTALETALDRAEILPGEVDALFVCTCTGYLCPGVTSHVAERLGLRRDVFLQDLVGLGCGAAVPTLRSANGFLALHPDATVAVVAVEICSAAFFVDDNPGVLISLCLFGDGASASIWRGTPPRGRVHCELSGFSTLHRPEEREKIRFVNEEGKLKNKLHKTVPELAASAVRDMLRDYEDEQGPVEGMVLHPGGRDVLDAIEQELPGKNIFGSREVLRDYGNLSSPSVLIALEKHLDEKRGDQHLWMSSYGAGFACHGVGVQSFCNS